MDHFTEKIFFQMARSGIIFLLGIFCLASSIATDDFIQMLKNRRATRYCGTTLSEVLSVVCRGRYNTPPPVHGKSFGEFVQNGFSNSCFFLLVFRYR